MKTDFDKIVAYIKSNLDDLEPYVHGDERPTDLMDCGYNDGTWNTLIEILNKMGVEHKYKQIL